MLNSTGSTGCSRRTAACSSCRYCGQLLAGSACPVAQFVGRQAVFVTDTVLFVWTADCTAWLQQLGSSVRIKFNRSCTGCFRANLPYFGRTFVRLKYLTTPDVTRYDTSARRAWQSCGSTYCTRVARYVIGTLRRFVLEPQPGRSTPKDDFLLHQCVFSGLTFRHRASCI